MKFGKLKKKLLPELENIKPLLKRIADFHLYGSLGYGLTPPEKISGEERIPDINRAEVHGIRDALSVINSIGDKKEIEDIESAKNFIISRIECHSSDNKYYNFGKQRVISTIENFSRKSKKIDDLSWRILYLENEELLVTGKSEGIMQLINNEKKIYWKTYLFESELKNLFLKEIDPTTEHFYIKIEHTPLMENFELKKEEVQEFIFRKLFHVIRTYFPSLHFEGTRIKASIVPPLVFLVFTSNEVICLFLLLDEYKQTLFFLLPLCKRLKCFTHIYFHFIRRYIDFLEGNQKEELFSPLVFWVERKYLQCSIPPDAKRCFDSEDSPLLFSRETGFFFRVLKEGEPYYRVTILPCEYLSKLFNPKNEDEVL